MSGAGVTGAGVSGGAPPGVRVVTVDGPAGSGKTTLGRRLALALALPLIDTGLFYRGLTVAAVSRGIDTHDSASLIALAESTELEINTDPEAPDSVWHVRIDGVDLGAALRDPGHASLLSRVSSVGQVRTLLLDAQRRLARAGAVAVGRDCGTVVFPGAAVKFYLVASEHLRAERRAGQLRQAGRPVDSATLRTEVAGRDAVDSGRTTAPLRPAADAHVIDTGDVDIEAMVDIGLTRCRAAGFD